MALDLIDIKGIGRVAGLSGALQGLIITRKEKEETIIPVGIPTGIITVAQDGSGDYELIQDAINALGSSGGTVQIKEGDYAISTALSIKTNNTKLIGSGRATKLSIDTANEGLVIAAFDGVEVRNIYFLDTGAPGTPRALVITNANNTMIKDNWFEGFRLEAINISGGVGMLIIGNQVYDGGDIGIEMHAPLVGGANINNNRIDANRIYNNAGDGVYLDADLLKVTDDNVISSNIINGNGGFGVNVANARCNRTLIINNNLNNNTGGAVNDVGTGTLFQDSGGGDLNIV